MGANTAKIYHAFLIVGGLTCQAIYLVRIDHPTALVGLLPGILLILHVRKVMRTTNPKDFDPELKKVALSTFAIALLSAIGLILN